MNPKILRGAAFLISMKKTAKNSAKEQLHQAAEHKRIKREQELKINKEQHVVRFFAWLIAALGVVLYINTLGHYYALDDFSLIIENAVTKKGFSGLKEIFKTGYRFGYIFASDNNYRPMSKAMFAVEWALAPNNPLLGHFMNVLLYGITGFFLTITLYKYFKSSSLAIVTGFLYIAHPIHTEVVANIKSRDEILAFLFSILTMYAWRLFVEKKKNIYVVLTALFFFLALLSKESAITFLAVFVLIWYFFSMKKPKDFVMPVIGIAVSTLLFLVIRHAIVGGLPSEKPSIADNLLSAAPDAAHRFATAVYIAGLYLKLLFFPHPLVFDYSYNQIPIVGLSDWQFVISFILLVSAFIFAIIKFKNRQPWVFGILFFFITFSISSNILFIIGTNMGERLMYTPSLGFCLALGFLFKWFLKAKDGMASPKEFITQNSKLMIVLSVVVVLFSFKTVTRNTVWKNNLTLYTNDVKLSPNSTRTHYYLGNNYAKDEMVKGKTTTERDSIFKLGIVELRRALEIYPPFVDAWNQLGVIYNKMNNANEAMKCYQSALKYNPTDPTVHNNIGTILFQTGNFEEAKKAFTKALELNPNYIDAYFNLASVYGMNKEYNLAVQTFQKTIQLDPNNASAYHYLGITYQYMGDQAKAAENFEKERLLKGS